MSDEFPRLTVDGVLIQNGAVLLVKRRFPPFEGCWALPGGFVEFGETCEAAVVREVSEETGLQVGVDSLVGVYSDPARDPRGHTVSVVYRIHVVSGVVDAGDDAEEARFFLLSELPDLAFDHEKIFKDVLLRGM